MNRFLSQLFIIILGFFNSSAVFSGVYRCVGQNGRVEFRDHPCQNRDKEEHFLPYVYEKTDRKMIAKEEKELKKTQKRIQAEEKRQIRMNAREKKHSEKEALKAKRRLDRCLRTQESIALIQKKLQFGCKLHRCRTLKQQLEHYEKMKHKYCNPG